MANIFYITAGLPPIDNSTSSPANTFYITAGFPPADLATLELIAPLNNATGVSSPVTFSWEPVVDATAYQLQIATDDLFVDLVYDNDAITEAAAEVILSSNTQYYWRVRALTDSLPP